jgi:hypothetical protein
MLSAIMNTALNRLAITWQQMLSTADQAGVLNELASAIVFDVCLLLAG